MESMGQLKRAIALGGGGPAVGLGLGALKRLDEAGLNFDVWSLSCIGAWLGCAYQSAPRGTGMDHAEKFFRSIARPDAVNRHFPIPTPFAPDFVGHFGKAMRHMMDPASYQDLFLPGPIMESMTRLMEGMANPKFWSPAYQNLALLNDVLAVNPISRFMTSMIYRSGLTGLARMHYPDAAMLDIFEWSNLFLPDRPVMYFNAYNLTDQRAELFVNRHGHPMYKPMSMQSLMACSALPYILEPIEIDGKVYCEGATVDTVNLRDLLDNHPDLDEIWVIRILAKSQIHPPKTLLDAFNNLVMLFASTSSEDSIALFRLYLQERRSRVRIIEVPVYGDIVYEWSQSNLDQSIQGGYDEADKVVRAYRPRMGLVTSTATLVGRVSSWQDQGLADAVQRLQGLQSRNAREVTEAVRNELALLAGQLPQYIVMARHARESQFSATALRQTHAAHHQVLSAIKDILEEIDHAAMTVADYERVHASARAIHLLQEVDSHLRDMVGTIAAHASEMRLMEFVEVTIDAIDFLLLSLADAVRTNLEDDRTLLRKITGDRTEVLRGFRERFFPEGAEVAPREAAALLSISDKLDQIVGRVADYESLLSAGALDRQPISASSPTSAGPQPAKKAPVKKGASKITAKAASVASTRQPTRAVRRPAAAKPR